MYNKLGKIFFSRLISTFGVSKRTNEVLREILHTVVALAVMLLLSIDWDATLDNLEILGGAK